MHNVAQQTADRINEGAELIPSVQHAANIHGLDFNTLLKNVLAELAIHE